MKRKTRYIAFNTHLILCIIMLIIVIGILCVSISAEIIISAVVSALLGLLTIFVILISPIAFVFTQHDVTIIYWFGLRETIKWSNIKSIWETGSWILRGGGTPRYVLSYPKHGKKAFFMNGEITKTFRTNHLVKKFWNKKIV